MQIKRNRSIEQWLFDEIRNNWGKEARKGIHLSDLLAPRKAYWQKIKPMYPTDQEIQFWLTGKGHEGVLARASGYEHASAKQWEDIWYTPDFFHNFCVELKTRRRGLAEEGKEIQEYDYYLKQLLGYCAVEDKPHGWLHVWCLVQKQEDGTTKPEIAAYEVDFTQEELEEERKRLLGTKHLLLFALEKKEHRHLEQCPVWMCGRLSSIMIKKPFCKSCNREFESEWGSDRHINSRTGAGHDMQPAEFKQDYIKSCKWFDDCKPILGK